MTGLYMRVSMGDDDLGERKDESNSIENQRLLLRNFLQGRNDLDGQVKEYVDATQEPILSGPPSDD